MLRAFYLVIINSTIVSDRPNCCMFQEFRERERGSGGGQSKWVKGAGKLGLKFPLSPFASVIFLRFSFCTTPLYLIV